MDINMYTYNTTTGITTRDNDNAIVSPVDDVNDLGFLEYNAWAQAGNSPAAYTPTEYSLIVLDPAQFRKALLHGGDVLGFDLLNAVETALQDPSRRALKIDYEYKPSFHSNDQRIIAMALELGLTDAWLYENIFVYGQNLN